MNSWRSSPVRVLTLTLVCISATTGCKRQTPGVAQAAPAADKGNNTHESAGAISVGIIDTIPKSLRANEPAGFVPFAISSASHVPQHLPGENRSRGGSVADSDDSRRSNEDMGRWYTHPLRNPRMQVIDDPTAPMSPPKVMQIRFPAGWEAGRGPATWGGWDNTGKGRAGQKEKVYFSMWLKIQGPTYENEIVGTKMGFFGAATPTTFATHNTWFFLKGFGRPTIADAFPVEIHQSFFGPGAPRDNVRNIRQNIARGRVMTAGVWHHWEALLELNTPGATNGVFKWWIDGQLVMSYSNMTYIYGNYTNGFYDFNFNPTWGGRGDVKTKEDAILIDHIYMSGVPMTSIAPEPVDRRSH